MCIRVLDFGNARTLRTFDQDLDRAIGQFKHLQNGRDTADFINVFRGWIIFTRRLLRCQHDAFSGFHRSFKRTN